MVTAHGSMNHIAFAAPLESFDEHVARPKAKGVEVTAVLNHDNSPMQVSAPVTSDVFVRSVSFFDPDGIRLEFAAWAKAFDASDGAHDPMTAEGVRAVGVVTGRATRPAGAAPAPAQQASARGNALITATDPL